MILEMAEATWHLIVRDVVLDINAPIVQGRKA
jgi:hypothetical protein